MIKNIVAKLKGIYIGWDYDKYWDCREALFDPKTCRLKFLYCKHYVSITNRRQNADIAYCIEAGNNFKGRPILGHNLNGIVIAAGAIIGKNCFLSHQVTIGRNRGVVDDLHAERAVVIARDGRGDGNREVFLVLKHHVGRRSVGEHDELPVRIGLVLLLAAGEEGGEESRCK